MRCRRDDTGASAIEYGLLLALVAAISIPAIDLLETAVTSEYTETCRNVATYDGDTC